MPEVKCKCGCGGVVPPPRNRFVKAEYIQYHHLRGNTHGHGGAGTKRRRKKAGRKMSKSSLNLMP